MKILLIEDELALLDMYQGKLEREGFTVKTATDGQAGLALSQAEDFDVILLDIIMPKMNGLDVLQQIRQNPKTKDTAVYLLSNIPEDLNAAKVKGLGATGYFFKADTEPAVLVDFLHKLEKEEQRK